MTFRSLTIEKHSTRESAQAAYQTGGNYELMHSLNAYTFQKSLWEFAREQKLEVSYVDNAWLRVAMDGRLLKRFLSFGQHTEIALAAAIAAVECDRWYVVNEEEF